MSFIGTPTKTLLGAQQTKITGVTLAAGASGTITNAGGGGDIELPVKSPTIGTTTRTIVCGDAMCSASRSSSTITIKNEDGLNASNDLEIWIDNIHSEVQ